MIGWENNQGAYFIQKLQEQIDNSASDISDIEGDIGKMSDLTTTADNLVGAINEVDSDAGTALEDIGTMSSLETTATDLVGAINEVKSGLAYTLAGTQVGTTAINIPAGWQELSARITINDDKDYCFTYHIAHACAPDGNTFKITNGGCRITLTCASDGSATIAILEAILSDHNYTSSSRITVAYR